MALIAVDDVNSRVLVADPIWGLSDFAFADYCDAYRGPGNTWTHAYLTQSPAGIGGAPPAGGSAPFAVPFLVAPLPVPADVQHKFLWAQDRLSKGSLLRGRAPVREMTPHDVYFLTLTDAAAGGALSKAKHIGWRSYQEGPDGVVAVEVDFDENGQRSPHMTRGAVADSATLELQQLKDLTTAPTLKEIRLLKAPAVNLQALWMIFLDPNTDLLVPLSPAPPPLQAGRRYSGPEFENAIRPLAQKRLQFEEPPPPKAP